MLFSEEIFQGSQVFLGAGQEEEKDTKKNDTGMILKSFLFVLESYGLCSLNTMRFHFDVRVC